MVTRWMNKGEKVRRWPNEAAELIMCDDVNLIIWKYYVCRMNEWHLLPVIKKNHGYHSFRILNMKFCL